MASGRRIVSSDDLGPLVNLATWLLVAIASLATVSKWITKYTVSRTFQIDDLYALITLLFAGASAACSSLQVRYGLGQHINKLPLEHVQSYQKALYAGDMIYVPTLAMSKLTTLQLVLMVSRSTQGMRYVHYTMGINALWTLISVLTVAFQCDLPRPWSIGNPDHCIDRFAFWTFVGVADIIVDIIITVMPIRTIWSVRMKRKQRFDLIVAFSGRLLVVPTTILRIIYIGEAWRSPDFTYDNYKTALVTQIDIYISVIVSCLAFLKPFLDSLDTGLLSQDLSRRNTETTSSKLDKRISLEQALHALRGSGGNNG